MIRPGAPRTPRGAPAPHIIDWRRRRKQQEEEQGDREQPSVEINEEPTIDIEHEEPTENIKEDRGSVIIDDTI